MQQLRVLIVEDNPDDAELILRELRQAGFAPKWERVETEDAFLTRLGEGFDLVLSDYRMPQFSGIRALELLRQSGREIPFILVSGTIGEDAAVAAMRHGVTDYLLKDRLARLGTAVTHALADSRLLLERRESEEALRIAHAQLRQLLEYSPAVLYVLRLDGDKIVPHLVSENIAMLLGFSVEEASSYEWWVGQLHPDDRELAVNSVAETLEIGANRVEYRLRHKNGHYCWVDDAQRLVRDSAGRPAKLVGVWTDITERKRAVQALVESEARFRELAETIQEVFWVNIPEKNHVLYISPAYEKIWGRTCQSLYESPGSWLDSVHLDDRGRIQKAVIEKQPAGTYDEEYRILRSDGAERWIHDRAFPVRGTDGALLRMVGVCEDITESKSLHEQFLRAQRMEAIGTLAGGIAHDLNNILAPLLMAPELLRETAKSEHERQLLNLISQGAQRGSSVVRQLLTFSRGAGGEHLSVQLRHLINEMAEIMRETFPRDIAIEDRAAHDLWPVSGDPTQIHQVLMNLCVNARDSMPDGGNLLIAAKNMALSETDVQAHAPAKAGPYVAMSVTDTGEGIPEAILGRIFDPFFTTKPPTKGTGLGLSTVLGIVRSHDGFIAVESKPKRGTTFTIYLPAASEAAEVPVAAEADVLPIGHGELILLVDDEAPVRTATSLILEQQGYVVLTASEGAEALAIFLKNREAVRLVLTDVMMPVMGGLTLIRALRAADPKLKLLAMSGFNDQTSEADLKTAGANVILPKPHLPRELLAAIRELLWTSG